MVALNFSPEFAGPVERREKLQTIRSTPRANVGDRLQLYTGQRTKLCRKLSAIDPVCTEVIEVGFDHSFVRVGHAAIGQSEFDAFARRDGFADLRQCISGLPADTKAQALSASCTAGASTNDQRPVDGG